MKKVKQKLMWIPSGAKAVTEGLIQWVESDKDKAVLKRKLFVCAGAAGGAVLFSVQVPAVGPAAIVLGALAVFAWFDRTPQEEMRMRFSDFSKESFVIGDQQVPGMDVLRKYIEAHPGESAAQLAERLSSAPDSPRISPRLMEGVMEELGLSRPASQASGESLCESTPPEKSEQAATPSEDESPQVDEQVK